IQDGKFHIAGPSNGGIAAFHVAAANPQYFLSVTAFPGYMWEPSTAKLQAISKMCVFMYVGEFDPYMWHGEMKKEAEFLRSKGTVARYTVEKGQPHRLDTLAGASAARLFDGFEETSKGCSPESLYDTDEGRLPVDPALTTTAFMIDGYRIVQNKGVVRGIIVRSRSIFGTIGGSLQTLIGGNITLFTELCERTRADAFKQMVEHARDVGANAVVGIRYDATEVLNGVTEVLCYGTAVVVEPAGR